MKSHLPVLLVLASVARGCCSGEHCCEGGARVTEHEEQVAIPLGALEAARDRDGTLPEAECERLCLQYLDLARISSCEEVPADEAELETEPDYAHGVLECEGTLEEAGC